MSGASIVGLAPALRRLSRIGALLTTGWIAAGTLALPSAAEAGVTATAQQPVFSDTLVFSRYHHVLAEKTLVDGTTEPWPEMAPVDRGSVSVANTGGSAIQLTSATVADPGTFKVLAPTAFPVTIPAGGSISVQVQFTYNRSTSTPNHELVSSTLTLGTTDPTTPTRSIKLRGWWQTRPEGGTEPSLRDIVNGIYGFTTTMPSGAQLQANGGSTKPVGPEVHSAYWKRLDPAKQVRIVQLVAYHGSGKTESIFWGSKSKPLFIAKHGPKAAQTVLPTLDPANTGPVDVSRTPPVEPFSFGVGGEWSDPVVNSKAIDQKNKYSICTPSPSDTCGQHMRFWPAQAPGGASMPGSYIMSMDYGSSAQVNWDFQDNVYLIQNIQPASGVAPPVGDVPLDNADPGKLLYRVDTGAPAGSVYTDGYGRKWVSDKNMPSGASFAPAATKDENPNANNITGTAEDPLFRSYRGQVGVSKPFTYTLPTGAASRVSVRLYFAERFFADSGKRIFNIFVNDQLFLDNFDIWAHAGGKDAAYVITDDAIPVSGSLQLKFQATVNNPSVAAFEVFDTSPGVVPPPPATPLPTPAPAQVTPTPALPVPTATPTPTPAPAGGGGAGAPSPSPGASLPPGQVFSSDGQPLPAATLRTKLRLAGKRSVKITCSTSVASAGGCRIVVTLGRKAGGRVLAVKRLAFGKGPASSTKAVTFSSTDWQRIRRSGAVVRTALLASDGKTVVASTKKSLTIR